MEGGCTCRQVRYRLVGRPLIVHACHCRWCQRETGTAHALNALYEADRVVHTAGEPELVWTPSASGKGQNIARCPTCQIAIWSNYPQAGPTVRFVRVGTMDTLISVHRTFTSSRPPSSPEFYVIDKVRPVESLERAGSCAQKQSKRSPGCALLAQCISPKVAPSGRSGVSARCPLSGGEADSICST